jgi:hypothetical protein
MNAGSQQTNQTNQIDQIDQTNQIHQIEKNVEAGHPGLSPAIKNAFGAVTGAAEQAAIYALEKLSSFLGTDLTNKDSVNEKLEEIKQIVSDPKIQEKLMVIAVAAKPALQKFMEEVVKAVTESTKDIGEGAVKVIFNTLEEIPGIGILIGTARSMDTIARAAQSVVNTFAEVTTSASDAINETKQIVASKLSELKGSVSNMDSLKNSMPKVPSMDSLKNSIPKVPSMDSLKNSLQTSIPKVPDLKQSFQSSIPKVRSTPKSLSNLMKRQMGGKNTKKKSRILKQIRKSIKKFHDTTYLPNSYLRKRSRKRKY